MSPQQREWHRLFGIAWKDFFTGQPVEVEVEKDLSLQQQFLDVVLVRKQPGATLTVALPDGFDDLGTHNLISYKSHREALDGWAINELIGHYVNYRKLTSPSTENLLPEQEFRLYAVSARFPRSLHQQRPLQELQAGIYQLTHYTGTLRVVVLGELPQVPQNAMMHLFSDRADLLRFGGHNYRPRGTETTTLLLQLFDRYHEEGMPVPFTVEEFERQGAELIARNPELLRLVMKHVPVEQRLEGVPVEQRLEGVPVEQRLEGVPVEQRLEGVPVEQRLEGVPVEQRLAGLSAEELARLKQLLENRERGPSSS